MKKGHIVGVRVLEAGPDASLVEQAKARFDALPPDDFDGFEVWGRSAPRLLLSRRSKAAKFKLRQCRGATQIGGGAQFLEMGGSRS
jgi:hypothetical protein